MQSVTASGVSECDSLFSMIVVIFGLTLMLILCVLWINERTGSRIPRALSFLVERLKVNIMLSSSGYKSCLSAGKFVGVTKLPYGVSLFDIAGATAQGDILQFNDSATEVSYKVSVPNGASVRRTKRGRITIKRNGAGYTIKRSGYKCASMFSFVVYSLDSSLKWYFDGTEIEFPKSGNASLVTAPVGEMIRLFGYDSENRLCDGGCYKSCVR